MAEGPKGKRLSEKERPYLRLSDSEEGIRHVEDMVFLFRFIHDGGLSIVEAMSMLEAKRTEVEAIKAGRMIFVAFDRSREMRRLVRERKLNQGDSMEKRRPESGDKSNC